VLAALLATGADANCVDASGAAPLELACAAGMKEAAEVLLKGGVAAGASALAAAAAAGESGDACLELLLAHGADARAKDARGATALHAAAAAGVASAVSRLLAAGAPADAENARGATPLLLAARGGHEAAAELLLAAGAAPDGGEAAAEGSQSQRGAGRLTPALVAIQRGHAGLLRALLVAGAGPETAAVVDGTPWTPLQAAAQSPHGADCVRALLAFGAKPDTCPASHPSPPLHLAAAGGRVPALHSLLASGAATGGVDGGGATALHHAVYAFGRGDGDARARALDCAAELMGRKADPTAALRGAPAGDRSTPAAMAAALRGSAATEGDDRLEELCRLLSAPPARRGAAEPACAEPSEAAEPAAPRRASPRFIPKLDL